MSHREIESKSKSKSKRERERERERERKVSTIPAMRVFGIGETV